jgi:hypothetical protein
MMNQLFNENKDIYWLPLDFGLEDVKINDRFGKPTCYQGTGHRNPNNSFPEQ